MSEAPSKVLVLTIEVPEWWADDTDERLACWTDGEEPTPADLLEMFTEEDMQRDVILSVVGISHGEDADRLLALDGRIVGVTTRPLTEPSEGPKELL